MSLRKKLSKLSLLAVSVAILSGCAGTRTVTQEEASQHLENADYKQYAMRYLDKDGKPAYDPESLLDALEAGKAFNDAGMWRESVDAFDAADRLMLWKSDTVDTPAEVANLMGTTLTSDAFGAYQGKIYQGGLIDYYQAINMLMLGRESDARVSFNRLEDRQENALAQLQSYVKTVDSSADGELNKKESLFSAKSLSSVSADTRSGLENVPTGLKEAKIRNAAGDVMSSMFRATSSARQDKSSNSAKDSLRRAASATATEGGATLVKGLQRQLARGGELKNKVLVVYEDGTGPSLSEFRIDLPLFIVTDKVTYTGIALPRFENGKPAYGQLSLGSGKRAPQTVVMTDINNLAGLEFKAGYQGVVTKAVISTVIKTAAQAVINHQIERETGGGLLGGLLKAGVGAAQYAMTKADTRTWANLPNTVQMAMVDKPKNGVLELFTQAGQPLAPINLPESSNALVLVKASGVLGKPAVYVQALPAETQVAGL